MQSIVLQLICNAAGRMLGGGWHACGCAVLLGGILNLHVCIYCVSFSAWQGSCKFCPIAILFITFHLLLQLEVARALISMFVLHMLHMYGSWRQVAPLVWGLLGLAPMTTQCFDWTIESYKWLSTDSTTRLYKPPTNIRQGAQ